MVVLASVRSSAPSRRGFTFSVDVSLIWETHFTLTTYSLIAFISGAGSLYVHALSMPDFELNESETRSTLINPLPEKAGWVSGDRTQAMREIPVDGYNTEPRNGVTNYCHDHAGGTVLGVTEAIRRVVDAFALTCRRALRSWPQHGHHAHSDGADPCLPPRQPARGPPARRAPLPISRPARLLRTTIAHRRCC